jgi:hypothetical protein
MRNRTTAASSRAAGPLRSASSRRPTAAALALGPRANRLAPFRDEFPPPPRKTIVWESAPSGYLKNRRSRFSPVSPGTQTSRKPSRRRVPNCVTWAGTSSRPSLPSTPHPQTSGKQPLRRGTDSPLAPCATLVFRTASRTPSFRATPTFRISFCVPQPASYPGRRSFRRRNPLPLAPLCPAPRLASRDRCRALRLAPRPTTRFAPSVPSPRRALRLALHPAFCDPCRASRPSVCATPCNPYCASRLKIARTQVHPSVADIRPLVLTDSLSKSA